MRTNAKTINRKLERTMTVQDLIDALSDFDPDAQVVFACDYGDYHHTQQALQVTPSITTTDLFSRPLIWQCVTAAICWDRRRQGQLLNQFRLTLRLR